MHTKALPKQFLRIYDKPIIIHTIEHFQNNPEIDAVAAVCVESWIGHLSELVEKYKLTKVKSICPGGETGQLSIYNGLCAAEKLAGDEDSIVLIHDGVRPLINSELLSKNIEAVKKHGSAITSGIVKETIVEINDDGSVRSMPNREHSRVAKAPQSFMLRDIISAHRKALELGITDFIDSCSMMNYFGYKLYMIDGPYENIKITTPDDYYMMRAILQVREDIQLFGTDGE